MPDLTLTQWLLAVLGAISMGLSKAGFSGTSLLHVLIFAFIFGARASSGIVLPMLIAADVFAVRAFRQHTQWRYIRRMLPPTILGILIGFTLMGRVDEQVFRMILGTIILCLALLQVARLYRPGWFGHVPHSTAFAWAMGIVAGIATMLANAAGPIFSIYALSVALPKFELVGTGAWFFFIVNVLKVPFSAALGLIDQSTLVLNLLFVPAVVVGIGIGRSLTARVPQQLFDGLLLGSAALAATRLIGLW
jgi:uncharacterized membrane protein YfcA